MKKIILCLIIGMILLIPIASADTCSFINITQGEPGDAATIGINSTFSVVPGSAAQVNNVGSSSAAMFDFFIPIGATGATGETGATGAMNQTPGAQGIPGIPGVNGTDGTNGTNGAAATIAINNTVTLAAGQQATVTNIGTSAAALFDFGIPAGATGAKGDKGDAGEVPDVTQFLFLNGTRAMTGNLSMGSKYINSVITGNLGSDAVNRSFVTSQGYITSTYNATYDSKPSSTYNSTYHALVRNDYVYIGNGSYILGTNTTYALDTEVTAVNTSMKNYVDGQISGVSNYNSSYNSLIRGDYVYTGNGSYLLGTNTSIATTTYVGQVNTSMKNYVDARPDSTYNASYWTGTNYNASYWTGTNYNASYITSASNYNASYDSKAPATVFGYVTLMAGSSMITTTNPATMTQAETSSNKNNYITVDFTDGGSEVAQWIMDFPADWNYSANVVFTPVWTATSGSGTFNATIKAKLFPDDAALDTALATVGTSVDTLTATGDVMVSPATNGAAITSVGTGGNTAIIQVSRDSTNDTLNGVARLIGLRVKYTRVLAG